ncbi:MAG: hypothetical protein AB8B51_15945 [Sedimentitalea sp.]
MLKLDLASTPVLVVYGAWIAAIAISVFNAAVKRRLISTLKEFGAVPFDLAFFLRGLTTEKDDLDDRYKRVNTLAKTLFAGISGSSSNLAFLHHTDDILSRIPTRT